MRRNIHYIGLVLLLVLFSGSLLAENIAVVIRVRGDVQVTPANSLKAVPVRKGQVLKSGDKLQTGDKSFCSIKFLDDRSLLRIKQNSTCTIQGKRKEKAIEKNILAEVGSFFLSLFRQRENLKVTTPTSVASVKGTKFWVIQPTPLGPTRYVCTEGVVEIKNEAGKVLIRKGQTAEVLSKSQLPRVRLTGKGDIPDDEFDGNGGGNLDFEFTDASGQKKIMRIELQNQEK